MKLIGAALLLCISTMTMAGEKAEVCHIPQGNNVKFHTITVSEKAVAAHLKHGDKPGACGTIDEVLCDDGDQCTVDTWQEETAICTNATAEPSPEKNDCTTDQSTTGYG